MKSVKFKDIDRLSPISKPNTEIITKEIQDLKAKINNIRESNTNIKVTKNQLQHQIENLQDNIHQNLKVIHFKLIFLLLKCLALRNPELSPIRLKE